MLREVVYSREVQESLPPDSVVYYSFSLGRREPDLPGPLYVKKEHGWWVMERYKHGYKTSGPAPIPGYKFRLDHDHRRLIMLVRWK